MCEAFMQTNLPVLHAQLLCQIRQWSVRLAAVFQHFKVCGYGSHFTQLANPTANPTLQLYGHKAK